MSTKLSGAILEQESEILNFKIKRLRSYRGGEEDKVLRWSRRRLRWKKSG